ncbi:MAG: phenylalanine--tRNA ligase subunit beta, partial [Actinomycetes bacterium]
FPWASHADFDALGLTEDDSRRDAVRLANPLADTAPLLRTSLLPGLFGAVQRNTSRGQDDLALFEAGRVFFSAGDEASPLPGVQHRPPPADLEAFGTTLPRQPRHLAAVLAGDWKPAGWEGAAERAGWQHTFGFAEVVADVLGIRLTRRAASVAPWHPGRCAALEVDGSVVGYAGELHPGVVQACGLPARTAALELDLDALVDLLPGPGSIASVSGHPVAKEDIALVVDESVPAADLQDAVVAGAGALLESVRLFDVYRGAPVPEGSKSLAFALRFRAPDRTLTAPEVTAARDAAVAEASRRYGARLRA